MIVELTASNLAALAEGEDIDLNGLVVRRGDAPRVLVPAEDRTETVRERRSAARAKLSGAEVFWMTAKFEGQCPQGCAIRVGARIVRDAAKRKTYCGSCGAARFPELLDRAVARAS